jgi:Ethanolamine utilization protein EutJ (predicted chaperonin)
MSSTIERKAGDRLNISGTLDEETALADAAWVGATAAVNIADATTGALVVDHGAATLDTGVTPKTLVYDGAAIAVGTYHYEFEVTLAGGKVRTWPNYKAGKCTLKVIDQLG